MDISSVSQSSDMMMEVLRMSIMKSNELAKKLIDVQLEVSLKDQKQRVVDGVIDTYV